MPFHYLRDLAERTGYNTDRVTRAIVARLDSFPLPSGYRIEAAGEIASRQESFGGLGTAILIAVFGILAILAAFYGLYLLYLGLPRLMKWISLSPATSSAKRVQRSHKMQRSRSSNTSSLMAMGFS